MQSYINIAFRLSGLGEFLELLRARMSPARGSEPLSSPVPVGQSAGIWRVVAGKMYARALDLSI